jgi:hypothetical protein
MQALTAIPDRKTKRKRPNSTDPNGTLDLTGPRLLVQRL